MVLLGHQAVLISSTFLAAVLHIIPYFSPLLSPVKCTLTDDTDLSWEMLFFHACLFINYTTLKYVDLFHV